MSSGVVRPILSELLWKLRGHHVSKKDSAQIIAILAMSDTLLLGKPMREVLLRAKEYVKGHVIGGASVGAQAMALVTSSGTLEEQRAWLAVVLALRLYDSEFPTSTQRQWVVESARALVEGRYYDGRPLDFTLELSNYWMFL